MKKIKLFIGSFFICLIFINSKALSVNPLKSSMTVKKIWSNVNHNAFTSLIYYKDHFYCAFREGQNHYSGSDGVARILISEDGIDWEPLAVIKKKGFDLRDPKFSVDPEGKLMVLMGGSIYEGKERKGMVPHVSFSDTLGITFTSPQPLDIPNEIKSDSDWLWRVTWYRGIGYGVLYQIAEEDWKVTLLKTTDGIHYDLVKKLGVTGIPNETTARIMPDEEMLMMVRRESGEREGYWGRSMPPYTDWKWKSLGFSIGGPDFIALDDSTIIAGTRVVEGHRRTTGLYVGNREGIFKEIGRVPSGGDNSYPGFVIHEGKLWFSYYSSHEGSTAIYIASVPLAELEKYLGD